MSQWDKLLKKICSLSKDVRFAELKKILESYGYSMNFPSGGSSHTTFRKQDHEPIKTVYVLKVKEIIESEVNDDENT